MNVNSGGPHILLFERDQQLTTLLSSELAQAGYEVHTARTAVEVFDAIARFSVRLVMVDLAQAQAGRREFWVALDAQRRGRGVQVFTFRCTNLGGYGPDDPDERVETVLTDMEVDGPSGASRLVEAVRARVPGATVTSAPARPAPGVADVPYQSSRPIEAVSQPLPRQASPIYQAQPQAAPAYQASPVYQPLHQASPIYQSAPQPAVVPQQQSAPIYQSAPHPVVPPPPQAAPVYQSAPHPVVPPPPAPVYQQQAPPAPPAQPIQATYRPQPVENYAPPPQPARQEEAPRPRSTFTDKIRAVFYPSSQSFSSVPETSSQSYAAPAQAQHVVSHPNPDAQPRPRASQRFAEAEYPTIQSNREEMIYQAPVTATPANSPSQSYTNYAGFAPGAGAPAVQPVPATPEESGLDQLSRLLRESQPTPQQTVVNGYTQNTAFRPGAAQPQEVPEVQEFRPQNAVVHGNTQNSTARAGLSIDPQEIQDFRAQILQAARQDEARERSNTGVSRAVDPSAASSHLRASPIQDIPFEQEVAQRRGPVSAIFPPTNDAQARPAMTVMQPTQAMPQMSQQAQPAFTDAQTFAGSGTQPRPVPPPETPLASPSTSQLHSMSPSAREVSPVNQQHSGPLSMDGEVSLPEHVRASLQQTISRRPEVRTTDDTLLDIVKSLPPMSPAPQPPAPQPQILNGRATRSLGSVLLEGHLVPQERLQVAQHVQRMMRGVDLNYQLGEILLMFKLLTPDQLLAASLVSYGMISTVQISSLGRIRQELYAMGLEYDLESLLVLFRILTPEQLREVRASWSS